MVLATEKGAALVPEKELHTRRAGLLSPESDYRLFGTRQEDVRGLLQGRSIVVSVLPEGLDLVGREDDPV